MQTGRLRITKDDKGWYIWDAVKGAMNISFEVINHPNILESILEENSDSDIVQEIDRLTIEGEKRAQTLIRLLYDLIRP